MHNFYRKMSFWERGAYNTRVINFSKNYWNIIIVPAAMAMLLEQCNGPRWLCDIDDDDDDDDDWWIIGLCSLQLGICTTLHIPMC